MEKGENNLERLLKGMQPVLQPELYVFCTLSGQDAVTSTGRALFQFREKEGLTVVLEKKAADELGLDYQFPCRLITLMVHSDLNAVGFLAAITRTLAAAGISVNAVSAFYHDHIFVPEARAAEALQILLKSAAESEL